jgi:hypothetical protein
MRYYGSLLAFLIMQLYEPNFGILTSTIHRVLLSISEVAIWVLSLIKG